MTQATFPKSAAVRAAIAAWEPELGAIIEIDAAAFDLLDTSEGPLAGVAVGVKDIVDVAGLPTRNGSAACADAAPAERDAPVVAALRGAGAAIIGKTASTEFAFIDPTPTLNPHDPAVTPGGSSSGSGAAVGGGLLDIAIGTQTAGSLCRPAAYCGAVAFKPSYGALSTVGMTPFALPFDTIGLIARSVGMASAGFEACGGDLDKNRDLNGQVIGRAPIDPAASMEPEALAALEQAEAVLAAGGAGIESVARSVDLGQVISDHRIVMFAEAFAHHGSLLDTARDHLRPKFRSMLEEGGAITPDQVADATAQLSNARSRFWEAAEGYDAMIAPPTPGFAPLRHVGTGYLNLLIPWTVFGGALVCVPWGTNDRGLPLSVMIATPPGADGRALALGAVLEAAAPALPVPQRGLSPA